MWQPGSVGSSRAEQVVTLGSVGLGRGKVWSAGGTKPMVLSPSLEKGSGTGLFSRGPPLLERLCPVSIRLVWCSVEAEDWNRRLKICEIFTAAKFLDLLAHMRALVERSNLTSLFRACQEADGAERFHGNY